MRELTPEEVKALAAAAGIQILKPELPLLTVRLNGMLLLIDPLSTLPLEDAEIVPTLLTQRRD
jgi:hypothetical protein